MDMVIRVMTLALHCTLGTDVGEVQLMKLLPSTIDMCVWLNNRNSTMFLVTCK